jgi:hypothetical protein
MADTSQRQTGGARLSRSRLVLAARAVLAHRRLPLIAALLCVVLALPALGVGFVLDDYYHRAVLLELPQFRELFGPPSEMFRFFRGDPERTGRVMDLGFFPWWTYPGLKAEFCQVVTVWTHRLDYWLWPDSPALMHLQSLLWLGGLVAVVAWLYRRLFDRPVVAGLAAILFAVDDCHGAVVGFIANRNVLIAAFLGMLALIAHDRWRRRSGRMPGLLAPLLLALGLFAKEEGIGACAYLAAYGLFLDPAGWRRGCVALLRYGVVFIAWAGLRAHWGYGVRDMGLYIDPLTDPVRFAAALVERLPILFWGQWAVPPSDLAAVLGPADLFVFWCLAVAFFLVLSVIFWPLVRGDRLARFWALGMVLSAVPVCATFPMDRLLTFPGIGACGLLAQFLYRTLPATAEAPASRVRRAAGLGLAWFFVLVHLIVAPLALPLRAANPTGPKWLNDSFYVSASLLPASAQQTVVIVNAPSALHAGLLPLQQVQRGAPMPKHTRVLASGFTRVFVQRRDERTISIRPNNGYLYWVLDRMFRSERRPLSVGEHVKLTGMTAEVTEMTGDGRPAEVRFRFDVPLEDPSLCWLCYRYDRFVPFTPPPLGQIVDIPGMLQKR